MKITLPVFRKYNAFIDAILKAEKLFQEGNASHSELSGIEKVLSSYPDAELMANGSGYDQRLTSVREQLKKASEERKSLEGRVPMNASQLMQNGYEKIKILDSSILPDYNDSIKAYKNARARESLGKFKDINGELAGSNSFMLVHLANSGLLKPGSRMAERKDIETAISFDKSFLAGNYADFGLALWTPGSSYARNDLLAKILAGQLEHRGISLGSGKLISLNALHLKENENSSYGLVFELNENIENMVSDLKDYKWNYLRNNGLACAYLGRYRVGDSGNVHLVFSGGNGRVAVVSAEGAARSAQKNMASDDVIKGGISQEFSLGEILDLSNDLMPAHAMEDLKERLENLCKHRASKKRP